MYRGFTQYLVPAGSPDAHQFPFFVIKYITETLVTHFYAVKFCMIPTEPQTDF